MSWSVWTVPVYACCPNLIINCAPPFTVRGVLVWMINYMFTFMIRHQKEKNTWQCLTAVM